MWTSGLGMIPAPGAYPGCSNTGLYGLGSCLDGTWWSHAETQVGNADTTWNGVDVGFHGNQLTNHYFKITPDEVYNFSFGGIGAPHFVFLWQTLPDPYESVALSKETHYVVTNPVGQIGVLRHDGTMLNAVTDGQAPIVSLALQQTIGNTGNVWAAAVEPTKDAGMIDRRVEAVALSNDGTQMVDIAVMDQGVLKSRSEAGFPDFIQAGPSHPAPRAGFRSFYSSAAGGVFMLGGNASSGAQMHDIWFRGMANDWRPVNTAASYSPDRILAATYSFADRWLYVLDHSISGVQNAGYESGGLAGWTSSGASGTVTSTSPHSGTYAAMLGARTATNGDSSISQTFTAPTGGTSLSFWYKMSCPDTVAYDWATATLTDNTPGGSGTTTPLPKTCSTNAWTQVTASIASGHNYTLTLTSHDDNYGADPTYTLYDDVTISGVQNAGYESGSLSDWTSIGASEVVVSTGAHSGTYAAMLGAATATNGDSNISQTFTAPTGATSLSFWYKMTCPDTVTYDWATATLTDNTPGGSGTTTPLPKICSTNAWTQVTVSIASGHNYTLTLTSHDDNYGTDPTYTLYDDVYVLAPPVTVDTARLARINIGNAATQVLGTCNRVSSSSSTQYMTVDLDGGILITSGDGTSSSQIGHLAVDANGNAYLDSVDMSEGGLVVPPIVDANGYSLLTMTPANGATITSRKSQLAYGAPGQYPLCQLLP